MKAGSLIRNNGLSIAFVMLALGALSAQAYTGWLVHNEFLADYDVPAISFARYLTSGHFIQATFENWESEFLQMALFVIITIFLYQRGSSESRKPDSNKDKQGELIPHNNSPWPVKKGGFALFLYKHSLSVSLMIIFALSFLLHWYGSLNDFNEQQLLDEKPTESYLAYLHNPKFWFESFQNWQSEFLSVFAIVFLSIYLRQVGSPQSKAVNAPHSKTGED